MPSIDTSQVGQNRRSVVRHPAKRPSDVEITLLLYPSRDVEEDFIFPVGRVLDLFSGARLTCLRPRYAKGGSHNYYGKARVQPFVGLVDVNQA